MFASLTSNKTSSTMWKDEDQPGGALASCDALASIEVKEVAPDEKGQDDLYLKQHKAFILGRKHQVIRDRYPLFMRERASKMELLMHHLTIDEKTLDENVKLTLEGPYKIMKKNYTVERVPKKRTNGADAVHTGLADYGKLDEAQCFQFGKALQYLLDTDQKHCTLSNLSKLNFLDIIAKKEKLQEKIARGKARIRYKDPYKIMCECNCGRVATCTECGRKFCWKIHGTLTNYETREGVCEDC
jgi:hypothetical protein